MPSRHNYKKLFLQCIQENADKDQRIALLEQYITEQHAREDIQLQINSELKASEEELWQENILEKEKNSQLSDLNQRQEELIIELNITVSGQQKEINKNKALRVRLNEVVFELRMLKRSMYGRKSEKHHRATEDQNGNPIKDQQLSLDLQTEVWGTCHKDINSYKKITFIRGRKTTTPKKPGGRKPAPDLPEEITELHPDNIPPNSKCVGYKDQVLIACDPMRWYKKVIRRYVYLTVQEDGITHKNSIAPLPPQPIPRCKLDVSVLVMIIIDKYFYHIPLWRQQRRFLQYGMELSYNTLVYDVGKLADLLEPLRIY